MNRKQLLNSREYWIAKIQIDLFNLIETYRIKKGYTKTQLAAELGFTKGYITQVLNGDFDHKVSKLVDLALAFGKVPEINYVGIDEVIRRDAHIAANSNSGKANSIQAKVTDYPRIRKSKVKRTVADGKPKKLSRKN